MIGTATRNEELAGAGYAAFASGDLETLQGLFHPDAVWHANRQGLLAGSHEGWGNILRFFAETMELSGGTFRTEPQEMMANETTAAVIARSTGERGGRTLDDLQVHVFRIRDDKVVEVRQYVGDPDAVQAFWS